MLQMLHATDARRRANDRGAAGNLWSDPTSPRNSMNFTWLIPWEGRNDTPELSSVVHPDPEGLPAWDFLKSARMKFQRKLENDKVRNTSRWVLGYTVHQAVSKVFSSYLPRVNLQPHIRSNKERRRFYKLQDSPKRRWKMPIRFNP